VESLGEGVGRGRGGYAEALSARRRSWPRVLPDVPMADHLPPVLSQKAIGAGILHDYDAVTDALVLKVSYGRASRLGGGGSAQQPLPLESVT